MFIPMKSDGQNFVNMRKNKENKKKFKTSSTLCHAPHCCFLLLHFAFHLFFFLVGPICPFFFLFLVRFSPETIYFVPVSISFILIEYSLSIFHFSQKSRFQVSLYTRCLEFVKYSDCLEIKRNFSRSLDFTRRT